jgi:hypothetical protein
LTVDGVIAVVDVKAVADGRFADDPARLARQRAAICPSPTMPWYSSKAAIPAPKSARRVDVD